MIGEIQSSSPFRKEPAPYLIRGRVREGFFRGETQGGRSLKFTLPPSYAQTFDSCFKVWYNNRTIEKSLLTPQGVFLFRWELKRALDAASRRVDCFAENRATLHLHGGISPWISDGTPHQWITPAGENTSYPKGVSVVNVPGMPDPGPGAMTFFYTNQQSARLMFYHDHSWGITRLNVYAGEAAPYIITDATEQSLVNQGLIPGAVDTIPLVIQDKTFVPGEAQLAVSDETWDMARWGRPGNLWLPHVYFTSPESRR